jgi:peptide-methionine (R)-S-oxide reductase
MQPFYKYTLVIALAAIFSNCQSQTTKQNQTMQAYKVEKSEAEWLEDLGAERYYILRQKGTERPHTGEFNMHFEKGIYKCAGCDTKLFESDSKFNTNCGWPSFDEAIEGTIEYLKDTSHGMIRTEIVCANCGGHLGHVFDDGPTATGQRYCVNSLSIDFEEAE